MNGITERLNRSWQLFERSVQVIQQHPTLLFFPVVTGLLTTVIGLFFLGPVVVVLVAPHWVAGGSVQGLADSIGFVQFHRGATFNFHLQPLGTAILAGMYLLNMFLATMSSVAFNHQIMEALDGRPVSIVRGIEAACARWRAILFWSLLAGVVGLFIRALEERLALIGRLVAGLIGLAWSVAAVFAIPILARDPSTTSPFKVLTNSATTIKRTWGEMLAGYVGMGGMNLIVVWLSILFWVVMGASALLLANAWILLFAGVPWLLTVILYGYLASIASRVYLCALYLYAAEGVVPGYYETEMMNTAWKMRKASNSL